MMPKLLFLVFAILAIGSALGVVIRRNPVHSGVSLLMTFFAFACIYIMIGAQFLAVIQITVYAGAILVLVLFVIMLLNLRDPGPGFGSLVLGTKQGIAALVFVGMLVMQFATFWFLRAWSVNTGAKEQFSNEFLAREGNGAIETLGLVLFQDFLYPFEVASVLLLVAIIGAVILTRRYGKSGADSGKGGKS